MAHYDQALTLRQARTQYFDANDFGTDGGYGAKWVQLRAGPIRFAMARARLSGTGQDALR